MKQPMAPLKPVLWPEPLATTLQSTHRTKRAGPYCSSGPRAWPPRSPRRWAHDGDASAPPVQCMLHKPERTLLVELLFVAGFSRIVEAFATLKAKELGGSACPGLHCRSFTDEVAPITLLPPPRECSVSARTDKHTSRRANVQRPGQVRLLGSSHISLQIAPAGYECEVSVRLITRVSRRTARRP